MNRLIKVYIFSRYCSTECGRRLAAKRLALIMPSHIAEWVNRPTVADEIGGAELERISLRMTQARSELQALGKRHFSCIFLYSIYRNSQSVKCYFFTQI